MEETYTSDLFLKVAGEMGIAITFEPASGRVGEMAFPSGRRHLFKSCNPNLNPSVSVEIARDKAHTHFFLKAKGLATPEGAGFFAGDAPSLERAARFAEKAGYPVFVKPNNLGEGRMVHKVHDAKELAKCAARILEANAAGIAEELCPGNDYRAVVLDGRVISAYQRIPLTAVGNGAGSIDALLAEMKRSFPSLGRPPEEVNPADPRIDDCLARRGFDRSFVPARGERVQLLDNANLSTGGTSVDITEAIHPSFAALAAKTAAALGLRLAGVDFMAEDLTQPAGGQKWSVIEVNGEPDLDNYASVGAEQEKRLAAMYRMILRSIECGAAP